VWFQKISIAPLQRITGNSEEEGVSKAKIVKGKYEPKMEFQTKKKNLRGGSMDIFWNSTFFTHIISSEHCNVKRKKL